MEELRGFALGAGVPFNVALMYTMEEEFSYLVPPSIRYSLADHCSDVLILENDQCNDFFSFLHHSGPCA